MKHGNLNAELTHLRVGLNAPFSELEKARESARTAETASPAAIELPGTAPRPKEGPPRL